MNSNATRTAATEKKKYSAFTDEGKSMKERIRKDSLKKIAMNMNILSQFVES